MQRRIKALLWRQLKSPRVTYAHAAAPRVQFLAVAAKVQDGSELVALQGKRDLVAVYERRDWRKV